MRQNKFRGNVFVANLPHGYGDEQLAQLFDQFGIVLGAYLARDAMSQGTKGYGLVNIAPPRAAEAAIAAMNGAIVDGRAIDVRAASPTMAITMPKPRRFAPVGAPATSYATPAAKAPRPVIVEYRTRPRFGTPPRSFSRGSTS